MDYIKSLEKEISDHFTEDFRDFYGRNPKLTETEALHNWAERYSALYNNPSYINGFVEEVLKPKFGINYQTLLETLRSSGTTFTRYVESLLESRLNEGIIFGDEEGDESQNQEDAEELKRKAIEQSIDADEGTLDSLDDESLDSLLGSVELKGDDGEDVESEVDDDADVEDKANQKKSALIKKMLGSEDVDLSNEDGKELDSIMGRLSGLTNVSEKVYFIRDTFREKDSDTLQKLISKGTGMTLEESKMVLEMLDE